MSTRSAVSALLVLPALSAGTKEMLDGYTALLAQHWASSRQRVKDQSPHALLSAGARAQQFPTVLAAIQQSPQFSSLAATVTIAGTSVTNVLGDPNLQVGGPRFNVWCKERHLVRPLKQRQQQCTACSIVCMALWSLQAIIK